jgi:hypothetical protein
MAIAAPLCSICGQRHWGVAHVWERVDPCASENNSGLARNVEAPAIPLPTNAESAVSETAPREKFDRTAYHKKYMKTYMRGYRKRIKARPSSPDGTST